MSKESLAQQGGYYLTNKGPQHDEAWLIFMDMVNNHIPTFENKAEALHYFPMFRTWFGLQGLCKLPWNDIEPADNAKHAEPNKVPEHVAELRRPLHRDHRRADRPRKSSSASRSGSTTSSASSTCGWATAARRDDYPPYRAMGPVTVEEYESRAGALRQAAEGKDGHRSRRQEPPRRRWLHREYREDAVREPDRRGLQAPRLDRRRRPHARAPEEIGMDLPEVIALVKLHLPKTQEPATAKEDTRNRPAKAKKPKKTSPKSIKKPAKKTVKRNAKSSKIVALTGGKKRAKVLQKPRRAKGVTVKAKGKPAAAKAKAKKAKPVIKKTKPIKKNRPAKKTKPIKKSRPAGKAKPVKKAKSKKKQRR